MSHLDSQSLWLIGLTMIDHVCMQCAGQGGRMAEALEAEKVDKHRNPIKCLTACSWIQQVHQSKKCSENTPSDQDDHNYEESETTSSTSSDSNSILPSNDEVLFFFAMLSPF